MTSETLGCSVIRDTSGVGVESGGADDPSVWKLLQVGRDFVRYVRLWPVEPGPRGIGRR